MKIQINNDERVVFVGATGFGKTFLAKHFLAKLNRVLVIDPKHTFKLDNFKRARQLPFNAGALLNGNIDFHIIYRPRLADDMDLAMLIYKLNKMKDVTIYCDELSTLAEQFGETTSMLADVVRTGRERHVAVWSALQRPRWIPRVFFTEAEVMFQFNLRSGDDRSYMAQFVGAEVIDQIDKFNFWYARADEQYPSLLRLDLAKSGIIFAR
jgi:hypothetical protein